MLILICSFCLFFNIFIKIYNRYSSKNGCLPQRLFWRLVAEIRKCQFNTCAVLKHQLTAQIRIAQKGKELAKTEFTTAGDLSYYPSFEVRFGEFDKVKAVLMLNFQYDACGYPSGDNLVFWQNNNQLTKVMETNSVSDGGVFYSVQEYILPHQHGGIADHLIVTNDEAEFEGEDMKRTKHVYKITLYKWAGGKLVKEKGM